MLALGIALIALAILLPMFYFVATLAMAMLGLVGLAGLLSELTTVLYLLSPVLLICGIVIVIRAGRRVPPGQAP